MASTVTVSLEPHLAERLKALLSILPLELRSALATELELSEIHYGLLSQISRWARTEAARSKLLTAQLNPRDYDNAVSLLAGTRTSPSSKPPPDIPHGSESPEQRARRELNDRRALVAVLNGLLSIGCAGGAAWWAADKAGWRDEWKVLVALMVATIVGVSEIVLFLIWQSRSPSSSPINQRQRILRKRTSTSDKKSDDNGLLVKTMPSTHDVRTTVENPDPRLRHRTAHVEKK